MNLSHTFSKLTEDDCVRLVDGGDVVAYGTGQTVITQGQVVSSLMIIKSGNLRVTRSYLDDLTAEFAGPLGPGEIIGEMSLMDGQGASASLIADGDTEILEIPRDFIFNFIKSDVGFAARFYECLFIDLTRKLRSTNQRVLPVPP